MFVRIAIAFLIGAIVWILCVILGDAIAHSTIPVLKTAGANIRDFAVAIGVICGAIAFFTGWTPFGPKTS